LSPRNQPAPELSAKRSRRCAATTAIGTRTRDSPMRSTTFTISLAQPPRGRTAASSRTPPGGWRPRYSSPTPPHHRSSGPCGCAARSAATVIAQVTSLSIATVNRQVIACWDAGILRERADLAVSGAIGRPRVPVEVNHEPFLTLGIHIGAGPTQHPWPPPVRPHAGRRRKHRLRALLRIPRCRVGRRAGATCGAGTAASPVGGVAIGGTVDAAPAPSTNARLGWREAPVGPVVAEALELPASLPRTSMRWPPPNCCSGCAVRGPTRRPASTSTPVKRWATR